MHYYRERLFEEAILSNTPVKFEKGYESSTSEKTGDDDIVIEYEDFDYDEGIINFWTPGYYFIHWQTTSMTGFSANASWFELKYFDEEKGWQSFPAHPLSDDPRLSVINAASESGFMAVEVKEEDLDNEAGCYQIALFNTSNQTVTLSRFPHVKASILIYGVPYYENIHAVIMQIFEDFLERCCATSLLRMIEEREEKELYQNTNNLVDSDGNPIGLHGLDELEKKKMEFLALFNSYYYQHDYRVFTAPDFGNTLVHVLKVGHAYTFMTTGTLGSEITASGKKWFLRSSGSTNPNNDFPPLLDFPTSSGEAAILPCRWYQKDEQTGCVPVQMDATGIYFDSNIGGDIPKKAADAETSWSFFITVVLIEGIVYPSG